MTADPHKEDDSSVTSAATSGRPEHIEEEHGRVRDRSCALGIAGSRPEGQQDARWGLAFSGGGIRSATFNLGVLQGLVNAKVPGPQNGQCTSKGGLLRQFDYLSTVSGGGYIGSFFISLFATGRLDTANDKPEVAAEQAFQVFEKEPPGRLRGDVNFDAREPGSAPLAWLRENGRYMAPTGTGDMIYAAALTIRNWFAIHYVLGTVLLSVFSIIALAEASLIRFFPDLLRAPLDDLYFGKSRVWWSNAWWLALLVLVVWLIPYGLAFWLTHPRSTETVQSKPNWLSNAAIADFFVGGLLLALYLGRVMGCNWRDYPSCHIPVWANLLTLLGAIGLLTLLGAGYYWYSCFRTCRDYENPTISAQRVWLTRQLATGLQAFIVVVLLSSVLTAGQTFYYHYELASSITSATVLAVAIWIVRQAAKSLDNKEGGGILAKLPLDVILSVVGLALLFLVATIWAYVVLWIQWYGVTLDPKSMSDPANMSARLFTMSVVAFLVLLATWISGKFPGFLNLSTLQGLYSARLTRAYLGASNGERFKPENKKYRSVAEPHPRDIMQHGTYYDRKRSLAPIHIINVCLNQNNDPEEQLIQRDRKGKPLAILPTGFAVDGHAHRIPNAHRGGESTAQLTMGEWIGVSGAAFSTGIGRGSSLGLSLTMGLANIRLGRWWHSGLPPDQYGIRTSRIRETFKTQTYLFDELFASFHGTRRDLHYLSDGGHFENTAAYELLRPERGIRLIVVADCGCDPKYQFEDLGNLIRLVRIDFSLEIEVDERIARDPCLEKVFGTPDQFLPDCNAAHAKEKCALLLNVYQDGTARDAQPDARIVVIKPRYISGVPTDLAHYHATHQQFPQEPTADQFYDEAQWESYRKLGLAITTKIFVGDDSSHSDRLWRYLLGGNSHSSADAPGGEQK